ncbi:YigZ family protein [Shewanella sp. YIC-542]|uniref:YigZ family protein n=1 Tax=Shewanella mytili TaxID=3377111 RepID=UPI00398EF42B
MPDHYPVPADEMVVVEEEIKHSRFITVLFRCVSPEAFKQQLAQIKARYPGANHYCQAFIWSAPEDDSAMGMSDDGEPSGSAGRPMLNVLRGSGVGEVGVVVIRYFGGVKLGVGGLVRAYSAGVKLALQQVTLVTQVKREVASLHCDYALLADAEHFLSQYDVLVTERLFAAQVMLTLACPVSAKAPVAAALQRISQGQLKLRFSGEAP